MSDTEPNVLTTPGGTLLYFSEWLDSEGLIRSEIRHPHPLNQEEPMSDTDNPNVLTTQETLLYFSEWLDSEGLVLSDKGPTRTGGTDERTHEDLAKAFIEHWEADERGAILAGRMGARLAKIVQSAAASIAEALESSGDRLPGL